jgi:hypothetical protein
VANPQQRISELETKVKQLEQDLSKVRIITISPHVYKGR